MPETITPDLEPAAPVALVEHVYPNGETVIASVTFRYVAASPVIAQSVADTLHEKARRLCGTAHYPVPADAEPAPLPGPSVRCTGNVEPEDSEDPEAESTPCTGLLRLENGYWKHAGEDGDALDFDHEGESDERWTDAGSLEEGDVYRDGDEWEHIERLDGHGDTVLIWTTEGTEHGLDTDTQVARVPRKHRLDLA